MNSIADYLDRGDLSAAACPSRLVLQHMTSRWGVLVMIALMAKPMRFSALKRMIGGISERMLVQTLQGLEGDGLVLRKDFGTVPLHVEYSLTRLGADGANRLRSLADWVEENLSQIQAHQAASAEAAHAADTPKTRRAQR
jgi:DNA-binding HxlR family transcriptional regulator